MNNTYLQSLIIAQRIMLSLELIKPKVIAIDGPCLSGKTTISNFLKDCSHLKIVHMDDFFLPKDLQKDLTIKDFHIDFTSIILQVLIPFRQGMNHATYFKFNCQRQVYTLAEIDFDKDDILLLEGSYSSSPIMREYIDYHIFIDIDSSIQLSRLKQREDSKYVDYINKWIPKENYYFKEYQIKEKADITFSVKE